MHDSRSLSHVRWDFKYHVVFVPKYRTKKLYGKFWNQVGEILRDLCCQRGVELLEGTEWSCSFVAINHRHLHVPARTNEAAS